MLLQADEENMPEISRFFGIVIRMFFETGGPHHRPHIHAYYQDRVGAADTTGASCRGVGGDPPA